MFFVMQNDIKMEFMLSWFIGVYSTTFFHAIDVFFKKMALCLNARFGFSICVCVCEYYAKRDG